MKSFCTSTTSSTSCRSLSRSSQDASVRGEYNRPTTANTRRTTHHGRATAHRRARVSPPADARARSRSRRPRASSTSATSRSPIRRAWPPPATRSPPIRREARDAHLARAIWSPSITNGTAVLGLGNIGPLAGKPVMEGKACLFKKFAGIDVFDIELAENDPDKLVDIDRRARADVRRHQPRGHQGAGVLLHRAQAARADEDPGVPRRPARHRDHRRRGGAQRAQGRRQGHRQGQAGRARAPAPRRSPASTCWSALGLKRENICRLRHARA